VSGSGAAAHAAMPFASARALSAGRRPARLVMVVNVDWFFLSHRLPVALAARDAGLEVVVTAADTGRGAEIRAHGLRFVPLPVSRRGLGPVAELRTLGFLAVLYRRLRPDLVHHVTIKPVLYGTLAARLAGRPGVVNAISGLGYVFGAGGAGPLRGSIRALYRRALRYPGVRTIFQNPEDRDDFVREGLVRAHDTVLIRGSGVSLHTFRATPEPQGTPVVLLPARLLWEKGVGEFVEAARVLRAEGVDARFVLAGRVVEGNPTCVPEAELRRWVDEGVVEWWGDRADMPEVLAASTVVALPTFYKEGLPKVLLEAAACARPLVATDIPGCREIVRPGVNGVLIPPRDPAALAGALRGLLADAAARARMGSASRRIAEAEFSDRLVVEQTLALYAELLGTGTAAPAAE
jgi:glycosyltransferase involved in cell wall biosynthesis